MTHTELYQEAKKAFINKESMEETVCGICLDPCNVIARATLRICGHAFCRQCLKLLIQHKIRKCPMCRCSISSVDASRFQDNTDALIDLNSIERRNQEWNSFKKHSFFESPGFRGTESHFIPLYSSFHPYISRIYISPRSKRWK